MTTKEILDELAKRGVSVRPFGEELVARGPVTAEKNPRINALLKQLTEKYRRSPRAVAQQINAARTTDIAHQERLVN